MPATVDVYRTPGYDCTNNGISCRFDSIIVLNVDAWCPDLEAAKAEGRVMWLKEREDLPPVLVPCNEAIDGPTTRWTMFGGNFAYSADSRWAETAGGPIAIHDRIE